MLAADLVILAGGLGTRFGGDKALASVDPRGQTLMEYTLYDAHLAGVERAVVIVREEDEAAFLPLAKRWQGRVEIVFAHQSPPPVYGYDRAKPLGTGHALLCAQDKVKGAFVLANADDYYGRRAIDLAVRHALSDAPCVVGYPLGEVLPPVGKVSRAVLVEEQGHLAGIVECRVQCKGKTILAEDSSCRKRLRSDVMCSLNLLALPQAIFASAGRVFGGFLLGADKEDECLLARVISDYLSRGGSIEVVPSPDRWVGMTYADDRAKVSAYLERLVALGVYPEELAGSKV